MIRLFKIDIDSKRVFGLDILRTLAILFVVIEHGENLLPYELKLISHFLVFDGVSIFFVLSGFLIGGILIRSITINGFNKDTLLHFWIRRWFRTLPNYFLILSILFFLNLFFTYNFTFRGVKRYFIFMQNLYEGHSWFFPESWSISVEEWFYLVTPVLLIFFTFIFKITYKKSVLFTAVILIFVVTIFRYLRHKSNPIDDIYYWDWTYRKQVVTRLDSLMFGVIGAYVSTFYNGLWLKYKKSLFLLGIILLFLSKFIIPEFVQIASVYYAVFSFSLISISVLLLMPYLSDLKKGEGVLYQLITRISLISYSMYLLNLSIIQFWIINKIPWNNFVADVYLIFVLKYGLYWILLFLISIILYKYFEMPMMKIRENESINKNLLVAIQKK
jgi:peptidoglycan/LPS O-acetylase OafA/YrhL